MVFGYLFFMFVDENLFLSKPLLDHNYIITNLIGMGSVSYCNTKNSS